MTEHILTTSRMLWEALSKNAGLILSDNSSADQSYDDLFANEIRMDVFGGAPGDMGSLLEQEGISPERLLTSIFRALRPYPRMSADILHMFETAAARSSEQNLQIAVDIDDIGSPLGFDLEAFRDNVTRFARCTNMLQRRHWRRDYAWKISEILEESGLFPWMSFSLGGPSKPDLESSLNKDWLAVMASDHRFPDLPPAPMIGVPAYDQLVSDLWFDFRDFQAVCREFFGSYKRFKRLSDTAEPIHGWNRCMLNAAHDRWPMGQVEGLLRLGKCLREQPDKQRALTCLNQIVAAIENFTEPPEKSEVLVEVLDDLLKLPVWKRRHELYAVWIASVITSTLSEHDIEFHFENGKMAFPFRAVHVASIGCRQLPRLELWSELRSDALDPVRRARAMQPDYRLRLPVEVAKDLKVKPDRLVIECKQYRKSSTRNFADALTDYARGAPEADVILANYGPVSPRVLANVAPNAAGRSRPFGHVFPGGSGLYDVREIIRILGEAHLGKPPAADWIVDGIEIKLEWGGRDIDLDLFVTTASACCGYKSPKALPEVRFYKDDIGTGAGLHHEILSINPTTSDRFDIVVCVHSGATTVREAQGWLTISWKTKDGRSNDDIFFLTGEVTEWHVAAFLKGYAKPRRMERAANGFQNDRGWTPTLL